MEPDAEVSRQVLLQALSGRGSHVLVDPAVEEVSWKLVGECPQGAPHSIFQIVNHMSYWHDFALRWLGGDKPQTPKHAADSWPGETGPREAAEWQDAVSRFRASLAELRAWAESKQLGADRGGGKTALEILQMIASHNSYHIGQVAQLRRMLGAWPPPGGGATW